MERFFSLFPIKLFSKAFGKNIMKFCSKCNSTQFDSIFNYLFGMENGTCRKCQIKAEVIKPILLRWFASFDIDAETVENLCENVSMRKVLKNYFKGMAIFGVRVPYVTGAPLSVVWNYTKSCNLKCPHCFSDAKFHQQSRNELNTEQAKQVIDILAANDVVTVNFCGGEPLVRKDVYEVMNYAKDHQIYPSISTNATLLTKEACHKLHDAGVRSLDISLDSCSPESHDHLRGVPGAFELAVEGINNAVEFGQFEEIILNTTLTDYNWQEIPQIYEFVKDLGATKYYISRILPTGRGKNYMDHDVNDEIKKRVMRFMATKFIQHVHGDDELMVLGRGMTYYSRTCHELSNGSVYPVCEILTGQEPLYQKLFNGKAANLVHRLSRFFSGCATGLFYCGLDCDGMVLPCAPANHIKLGDILTRGLHAIWTGHPILNKIRERHRINGKCSKCSGRSYCGGCRLTARGLTGDWLGTDLSCPY